MLSMTGYGKGEYKEGGIELTCEIKTVNNRYLDVSVKAPRIFTAYEDVIRTLVREKLTRGHADVFVSCKDKRERPAALVPDMQLAASYVAAATALKAAFPALADDVTLTSVLRFPDVLKQDEQAAADEELLSALKKALSEALDNLNRMRRTEGEKLKADMLSRMDSIEARAKEIAARAPKVAEEYRKKLEERVREYLKDANADEGRLLTEVAVFADKSNIDEELTRLFSHISLDLRGRNRGAEAGLFGSGVQSGSEHDLFQKQRYRNHADGAGVEERDREGAGAGAEPGIKAQSAFAGRNHV